MSTSAHVSSLAALADFRAALCAFDEEARSSLAVVEIEIQRFVEWLSREQLPWWQAEVRRRDDAVAHAKADLDRCMMSSMFGRKPDCIDQKVALKKAKARLAEAEEKVAACKRWIPVVDKEISEFRAPWQQLMTLLDGNLPGGIARIDRMLLSLEAYAAVAAAGEQAAAAPVTDSAASSDSAASAPAPASIPALPIATTTEEAGHEGG